MHSLRYLYNRCRLALRPRVAVLPAAWAEYNRGQALILGLPAEVLPARLKLVLLELHARTSPPFPLATPVLRDDALTAYNTGEPEWAVREAFTQLWRQGWVGLSHTYPQGSLLTPPVTFLQPGRRLSGLLSEGYDVGQPQPFIQRA
ncbi:hypothetical protein [Hymenobacter pini]|uniref:hypothetical protein n=1 Tax=Hymenobacter pini TaxID=2880879 RepID=UPI001CF5CA4F|nr:hypothetical protein [Hymenobacter pini]MCA8830304.1 hypothetical protein [Hymenobacter pini]